MIRDQRVAPASERPSHGKKQAAPKINSMYKREYMRIPKEKRRQLLETIEQEQITIKDAALQLGINYSSAKNIVKLFRLHKKIDVIKHSCGGDATTNALKEQGTKLKRFTVKRTQLPVESLCLIPLNPTISLLPHVDEVAKLEPKTIETRPNFDFSVYTSQIYSRYFCI
eukprot:TRINITY_DN4786_c0_g4_i2.p1 TRINITY_DN4786_c0_g4~~TRINITY_DN4786_c0_g4_i2.p1  ORF type:complete len:169 (+),score=21.32 TRINITY_DN4786_c0_g4_i2:141-647(+)